MSTFPELKTFFWGSLNSVNTSTYRFVYLLDRGHIFHPISLMFGRSSKQDSIKTAIHQFLADFTDFSCCVPL